MLTVTTWLWGDRFDTEDVAKLERGLRRNLSTPFRFLVVTGDLIWDKALTEIKGCFARLRMFDPEWQKAMDIQPGERIVQIDLDTVITGPLDPLFDRPEPYVIMQGANASNPCPMNGSLQMLTAGMHPEIWSSFSLEAASKTVFHEFPDDQGWIWDRMPHAAGWKVGPEHGVYVYNKVGWTGGGNELPEGARLVTFVRKHPKELTHLDWVRTHWV